MKRILIHLLSLLMLTAQAEDLSAPSEVFVELPASEELPISEPVDDPVVESTPFMIGEEEEQANNTTEGEAEGT